MISMMIWVFGLASSIAAVCISVALGSVTAHLTITAIISFGIVAAAVNEHRAAELAGASIYSLAATAARYMGLLWAWSALSAFVVYALLLDWPYWMPVVVAMFVGCGLCLFVALVLDREATAAQPDTWATLLVSVMANGQFAVSAVLLGTTISMSRSSDIGLGAHRWVALNLMLCCSAALLSFTGYLILRRTPVELQLQQGVVTSEGNLTT